MKYRLFVYCVDWQDMFFLRLFMQVVITLSSVVSSLKMDATKILEEMDQFKELWNQVTTLSLYVVTGLQNNAFLCNGR